MKNAMRVIHTNGAMPESYIFQDLFSLTAIMKLSEAHKAADIGRETL